MGRRLGSAAAEPRGPFKICQGFGLLTRWQAAGVGIVGPNRYTMGRRLGSAAEACGPFGIRNTVAFSPNGKLLASASWDRTVRLWDVGSGALQQSIKAHDDSVNTVAFSPNSKVLASASRDRDIRLWDTGLSTSRQSFEGHSDWVSAVAFSPDGKLLASASEDRTVTLWDVRSGGPRQRLAGHSGSVKAVAFSPDGKLLASASWDGTVRLWDTGSSAPRQMLEGDQGALFALAFSPDGKLAASSSELQTIILWDASSEAVLRTIEVDDPVEALSFTEDGTALRTDKGLVLTGSSPSATTSRPSLSQAVFVRDPWVGTETEDMLWLPSRPLCGTIDPLRDKR